MKYQFKQKAREITGAKKTLRITVAALLALILAGIGALYVQSAQNRGKIDDLAAVSRARGQALGTANAKLTQHGIAPVKPSEAKATPGVTDVGPTTPSSTPSAERGRQGETGATGAAGPGPTTAQVQNAVADYCDAHKCGSGPTQAQVAAAVLTYCTTKDDCTGPMGASGKDATGKPGASGQPGQDATGVQGPQGPAPTADQISAAVTAYCSNGACTGPKGDTGDAGAKGDTGPAGTNGKDGSNGVDGKNGADAPHFTKITCEEDGTWSFTLSDGTVLTADGSCRAATITTTVTAPPTDPPTSPDPTSTAP